MAGKSLKTFLRDKTDLAPIGVRFSMQNLLYQGGILNIPLFLADHSARLLGLLPQGTFVARD